ncbi:response regulator [Echinimonas agarilytica]|uniref:Response regulator n=1 Tax=Echinimonas agarilytica TaxID=1215918 RepID=A0AA41WAU4_9GAMM|nr:response regulator [Echinimonas agarilytica]MCM2681051.1 response regulator [Echinimonas agarilytica]
MIDVLLIDDDAELAQLLTELLNYEGFRVTAVNDGAEGLAMAQREQHALVLLDVMLPSLNGFQVLKQLRQKSAVPVIMLTARGEPADRVLGLEHGADDYLPKPFTEAELIARMKAVMRRFQVQSSSTSETLNSEGVQLSVSKQTAKFNGHDLELTAAELAILAELLQDAGQVVDKEHLSLQALGRKLMPFDRSVDMHVSHLRKKLSKHDESVPIKTIRGKGYIWTAEVQRS